MGEVAADSGEAMKPTYRSTGGVADRQKAGEGLMQLLAYCQRMALRPYKFWSLLTQTMQCS
jgi:hypothetical protein